MDSLIVWLDPDTYDDALLAPLPPTATALESCARNHAFTGRAKSLWSSSGTSKTRWECTRVWCATQALSNDRALGFQFLPTHVESLDGPLGLLERPARVGQGDMARQRGAFDGRLAFS